MLKLKCKAKRVLPLSRYIHLCNKHNFSIALVKFHLLSGTDETNNDTKPVKLRATQKYNQFLKNNREQ